MFRRIIFWSHLVVGLIVGVVVFVLCLTGALLSFERQTVDWAESSARALPPAGVTQRMSHDELVASVSRSTGIHFGNVRYCNDPKMPARLGFGKGEGVLANAYTGEVLGRGATALRGFYQFVRRLHTNLAMTASWMGAGGSIADACNVGFVVLLLTGSILWWPRKWNWRALRNSVAIRFDVRGKQRDWNWHNALGLWALLPLIIMAGTGLVLSYRPVDQGVREFAKRHAAPAVVPAVVPAGVEAPKALTPAGWPEIFASVERAMPAWRSMNLAANPQPHMQIAITAGTEGEPHKRATLTMDRDSATITQVKRWENLEPGDRARAIMRTAHSGELGGFIGQIVAGLGCLAGVVLVYTGFALSWRRFFGGKVANPVEP